MFDIGWQELFILAVLAIIVIGPKDLPRAIRTIAKGIRKARSMARDLQDGMDDVIREAELDDLKEKIGGDGMGISKYIKDAASLDMDLDGDLRDEMTAAVEDFKSITNPDRAASKKAAPKKAKAKKAPEKKAKAIKAPAKKAPAKKARTNKTKAAKKTKVAAKAPVKARG